MYKDYDIVKLKRSIPEKNLSAGAKGTILMCYKQPAGYEIEFINENGTSILLTFSEKEFYHLFEL